MRVLHFPPQRVPVPTPGDHPSASDVAAYIDRRLPDMARERLEQHLADCAPCREELAESARLARSVPSMPRVRLLYSGLGGAAAAVIVLGVVALPRRQPGDAPHERAPGPAIDEIAIVSPRSGSTVSASDIRFVWRRDSTAAGYKVIVTTASGTPVWSQEAHDTSIAPPRATRFVDGGEFYWRVEASRVNGVTATSQTASFRFGQR